MNCTICNQKIELYPSAQERAKKYGGKTQDYTKLFTTHADCLIKKYKQDTTKLIQSKTRNK